MVERQPASAASSLDTRLYSGGHARGRCQALPPCLHPAADPALRLLPPLLRLAPQPGERPGWPGWPAWLAAAAPLGRSWGGAGERSSSSSRWQELPEWRRRSGSSGRGLGRWLHRAASLPTAGAWGCVDPAARTCHSLLAALCCPPLQVPRAQWGSFVRRIGYVPMLVSAWAAQRKKERNAARELASLAGCTVRQPDDMLPAVFAVLSWRCLQVWGWCGSFMPRQVPMCIVVGRPIPVPRIEHPTHEQVRITGPQPRARQRCSSQPAIAAQRRPQLPRPPPPCLFASLPASCFPAFACSLPHGIAPLTALFQASFPKPGC